MTVSTDAAAHEMAIPLGSTTLGGLLQIPRRARGLVIFAHGSGSSRMSPRNSYVAGRLSDAGFATLLFDLLTADEEALDTVTAELRFDIALLADRLAEATRWAQKHSRLKDLPIGYFGASTGAAAALVAAARIPQVRAIVSRGGRPDLAGSALTDVHAATLLIVGGHDREVIVLNRAASAQMRCEVQIEIVQGATHLFEEPGALEQVASLAVAWFDRHLGASEPQFNHRSAGAA